MVFCFRLVDGGFSLWTRWTKCSEFCGTGTQKRHRTCNNPIPKCAGNECDASLATQETRDCTGSCDGNYFCTHCFNNVQMYALQPPAHDVVSTLQQRRNVLSTLKRLLKGSSLMKIFKAYAFHNVSLLSNSSLELTPTNRKVRFMAFKVTADFKFKMDKHIYSVFGLNPIKIHNLQKSKLTGKILRNTKKYI